MATRKDDYLRYIASVEMILTQTKKFPYYEGAAKIVEGLSGQVGKDIREEIEKYKEYGTIREIKPKTARKKESKTQTLNDKFANKSIDLEV